MKQGVPQQNGADLRYGGGSLVLDSSVTRRESSELCVGPGHAGVISAADSAANTGMGCSTTTIYRVTHQVDY